MNKTILGISAYYHDSAAALVANAEIAAAAQEERFSRVKQDPRFPRRAVEFCLGQAGLAAKDLDYVVFYEKPLLKFDRLLETYHAFAPQGWRSFMMAAPLWLKTKLHMPRELRESLGGDYRKRIVFTHHHEAHAASAFFPSPFEEAAILTVDGVGEWDTASIARGRGNRIEMLKTLWFPHSLGLLYSAFTYFCGFKVNSGEYKLMGLAPYGKPKHAALILEKLVDLKEDGSLAMDMKYFNYCQGLTMTSRRFDALFGGPPRTPEAAITEREMDLAASIQAVAEEVILRMARTAQRLTGSQRLCLAGGVALNCVANGKLLRAGLFDEIWAQPAAGDAGGALGAALFVHHQLLENGRTLASPDSMRGAWLGPCFSNATIREFLQKENIAHHHYENEAELLTETARAISSGLVVGWFQDRMEFGPRSLGARSILGDARSAEMQSIMNLRIKHRESFRPFAPSVLAEDAPGFFELDPGQTSPYMLFVAAVRKDLRCQLSAEDEARMQSPDLRTRVNVRRSAIPAVTHVDHSARVQTVDEASHGRYYRLLREFKRQTGCGVMINTSFNIRGEPIVCAPQDAYRCFMATDMDVLVLENCLLKKTEQPRQDAASRQKYIDTFKLD